MGYEVWVAADRQAEVPYADHVVALPIQKKMTSPQNIRAVFEARGLIKAQKFDLISTHTTLASAIVRAAVLFLHRRPAVFCTVHGYLFHETDGVKKWFYLLAEKLCAPVTNVLIVMNHEDYDIASKHKLYKDKLYYINGMGIDLARFKPATQEERNSARIAIGISEDDFVEILPLNASHVDIVKYQLCKKFVTYLQDNNLSQAELARQLDIDRSRVNWIVKYKLEHFIDWHININIIIYRYVNIY